MVEVAEPFAALVAGHAARIVELEGMVAALAERCAGQADALERRAESATVQ